jgi:hypothetical protein
MQVSGHMHTCCTTLKLNFDHSELTSAPEHAESSDQPAVTRPKPKPRTVKSAALPPPPAKSPTASLSSQELPTPAPPLGPMVVPATSAAAAPAPAPHSSLPRIPDGASAWLADFSDYIIQDLGPQWNQLLSVFLEHERLAGFPVYSPPILPYYFT